MNPILRILEPKDWLAFILFGSLVFVILAKSFHYSRFINYIILPFNNKYIFLYNKKDRLLNSFHVFLTCFQILNTSLFLYLAVSHFFPGKQDVLQYNYPMLLGGVFLYIVFKTLLPVLNGHLFDNTGIFSTIIFKKMSYFNYGSMLFFAANLLLVYVNISKNAVFLTAISLFLIINSIGWIVVLKNNQNFITNYFFYFILYLCTLEIAPLVILGILLK